MTKDNHSRPSRLARWLRYAAAAFVVFVVLLAGGILLVQRVSDGPMGPLQGGAFSTGTIVAKTDIEWSSVLEGHEEEFQFELVAQGTSRITGAMVHSGTLYIPCDLGFMWGRFSGQTRLILNTLYIFKRWHTDAEEDGRAILRVDGKLYPGELVRIANPELLAILRAQLEDMARAWIAPATLGPEPAEGPRDIWFFRFDPHPEMPMESRA